MYIVMHCGGIPFNGDTIKTKSLGGSESAAYYMARALQDKGHHVILFTNSEETGTFDGVKYEYAGSISEQHPLGERFSFYAENTPHDICIIQRHPQAFARKLASKQNLLWLHDLALLRTKDAIIGQMWNVDKVLVVSNYHKNQVHDVWGIPLDRIAVVNNAVDHALYDDPAEYKDLPDGMRHLIYSSRPERGLIELVKVGGIMERLANEPIHLHVCGYDNTTPQMEQYYNYLWKRCEELPNVTNHGALAKSKLAQLQLGCHAWVYPTTFEEVSCITAMEAMAAGLPAIVSAVAALPETCADSGTTLIPLRDGQPDIDLFCAALLEDDVSVWESASAAQLKAAEKFTWANSAQQLLGCVAKTFADAAIPSSLGHHFLRHSDIKPFELLELRHGESNFVTNMRDEYREGYAFYRDNTYAKHYADYYQYEKDRGVVYGPEDVTRTSRFNAVASIVAELPDGARVLDYGCAHGHYTVALAKRFPKLNFVGADLAQSNVETAQKWADDEKLNNVTFLHVAHGVDDLPGEYMLIIAAEVIEHVGNPQTYVDTLAVHLKDGGRMVITTPYGPWEAQGYREHGYWRAHLHHFERADIIEAFGHHPDFKIMAAPAGVSIFHSVVGSYIYSFKKPTEPSRPVNYLRKTMQTMPDNTISCCMIVKNAETDIQRCLNSVLPHVQEVIIAVDETTTDRTRAVIADIAFRNPLVAFTVFDAASPTVIGFDAARNATLNKASCDWILWIDADEVLVNGDDFAKYARNSMYNGFAIRQHHMSHDPVSIIKVDLPCRLFRNRIGIKFFGCVHEHPEITLNEGLGPVMLLPRAEIVHHGYHDETVRRKRFDRNLPLLARDRKENPDRVLGKFLWLRDLAQSCQYEMEAGIANPATIEQRAAEGMKLWEELMDAKNYRLAVDALPYYSMLAKVRGKGFDFSFTLDANKHGMSQAEKQPIIAGYFDSREHALRLLTELANDKTATFERRYQ